MTVLVTGATGNVGAEVVAQLVGQGVPTRALVRDPSAADLPDDAERSTGDLTDPDSLGPALVGVDALFLLPGYDAVVDLFQRAGGRRIVLLSGLSAGSGDLTNAITKYMATSEAAVRAADLEWTIVRPVAFAANALRWLPQLRAGDTLRVPFAANRAAVIDPFDIAAVAVAALTGDGHHRQIYLPTGSQALLPEQQVATLADVLERPLRFEAQPNDEARAELLKTTPPEYVDALFDFYVGGSLDESRVRDTVLAVTGTEPRTFRAWAEAHAGAFR